MFLLTRAYRLIDEKHVGNIWPRIRVALDLASWADPARAILLEEPDHARTPRPAINPHSQRSLLGMSCPSCEEVSGLYLFFHQICTYLRRTRRKGARLCQHQRSLVVGLAYVTKSIWVSPTCDTPDFRVELANTTWHVFVSDVYACIASLVFQIGRRRNELSWHNRA